MRQVLRLLSGRMKTTEDKIKLVSNLITVSGIFCIAVSLLLLINFIHVKSSKPLESKALAALVEQFRGDSQNEDLKNDIRNLDLLARKAFFTGNWQIRTGSFLLLFGGILFAGLLRIYHDMKAKIGAPLITGGTTQITRLLSQRWILIAGGLLLGSALVASFLTTDYLKMYRETGRVAQVTQAPEVRTVEVETGERRQETRDQETRDQRPGDQRPGDKRPGGKRPGDKRPRDKRPRDKRPGDGRSGVQRLDFYASSRASPVFFSAPSLFPRPLGAGHF